MRTIAAVKAWYDDSWSDQMPCDEGPGVRVGSHGIWVFGIVLL